ncbi:hypothetical protein GCM10023189_40090 [Nibrella saemangeumensis]|uniref:Uncharacterized protein n=1 Tax=Nibrella saemangeumensis TaxID=1084526 RepID=A0ABP8NB03_9BACT
MRFEEEVVLYQFGQGVRPVEDLVLIFSRLSEEEKQNQFYDLFSLVWGTKQKLSDVEQAIDDQFGNELDSTGAELKNHRFCAALINYWSHPDRHRQMIWLGVPDSLPEGKYEKTYRLLLRLFKAYYQRRKAMNMETPDNWRYWDLSQPETVEELIKAHQNLVEDVYRNPEFRSDFLRLARLEYDHKQSEQARRQQPVPAQKTRHRFATYDEVLTEFVRASNYQAITRYLLYDSLQKALRERYGLTADKSMKILKEVVNRHMQETDTT